MQLDALMPSPPPAAERGQRTIRPNCLRPLSRFGVTNARDVALARSQVTTLLKAQPAPQFGDDDGAVAHNDDDDDDDDRPVVHNDDDGDWAVAQLREQQQRRFAVEHQERGARHAKELVAAVKRREEAQGAAEPAEEWARQPHNRDIVRKGNYDEIVVELLDYDRIVAGAPGEFAVVVGAETHLFSDTEARPARCSLSAALQAARQPRLERSIARRLASVSITDIRRVEKVRSRGCSRSTPTDKSNPLTAPRPTSSIFTSASL